MKIVEVAKKYLEAGYSVIPVDSNKIPLVPANHEFFSRQMTEEEAERLFKKAFGIALVAGGKWGIEVLDFDLKYDVSGDLIERYKDIVGADLFDRLYCQSTMNGGYHLIYKTDSFQPNQKLAMRYSTDDEKYRVYAENYLKSGSHHEGFKAACNHKTLVLIETRGGTPEKGGGYALVSPTPGYTRVHGKIGHITDDERDVLISAARELNEVAEFKIDYNIIKTVKYHDGDDPFAKYNDKYDGIDMLTSRGWSIVGSGRGNLVRLLRPGVTTSHSSAIWHRDKKFLKVFSSSTDLDVSRVYSAVDLFVDIECGGDTRLAYQKLKEMGL